MAEYYNLKDEGKLIAWQFVGPKEKVLAIAGGIILTSVGEKKEKVEVPLESKADNAETPRRRKEQREDSSSTPEQLRLF